MSTLFSGHYLRNRSTLDIGVLGYIGIVKHKEHSPEFCPFLLGHLYKHVTIKGRQENIRDNEVDRKKAVIRRDLKKNEKKGFRILRNEK